MALVSRGGSGTYFVDGKRTTRLAPTVPATAKVIRVGGNTPFSGALSRLQLFRRALSDEETLQFSAMAKQKRKAPSPSPAAFAQAPAALRTTSIAMTAQPAHAEAGGLEYNFTEITGHAGASARPQRFIGLHFFSPVDKMQLVEVIVGKETSSETLAQAMDYVRQIRKTPIVVRDSRGFYTSRVFSAYVREGIRMLVEGVDPALIENAGKLAGMPVGPLVITDEVGLDVADRVNRQTAADPGEACVRTPAEDVIDTMVNTLGRIGKKAGQGFSHESLAMGCPEAEIRRAKDGPGLP